jgi:hypothetical protein
VKRFALTLLLAGALMPALAHADRAPTEREKAAIARAADVPKR